MSVGQRHALHFDLLGISGGFGAFAPHLPFAALPVHLALSPGPLTAGDTIGAVRRDRRFEYAEVAQMCDLTHRHSLPVRPDQMERRVAHRHFGQEGVFSKGRLHGDMIPLSHVEQGRQHIGHVRLRDGRADRCQHNGGSQIS